MNHDVLMARVGRKVKDPGVLNLIRRYLEAGLMEGGVASARSEGTPQGSPLSPLLSNILLDDLDRELERRGHRFCRYADDCNIYVQSDRAGQRVRQSITAFLVQRLKLKVNAAKSAVARPWERKFLGYSMTWHRKPKLTHRIAKAAGVWRRKSVSRYGAVVGRACSKSSRGSIPSCGVGWPTSDSPKLGTCWKNSMVGYGTSCGRYCGGNGSVSIGEHGI